VTRLGHDEWVDEAADPLGVFVVRGWLHEGSPMMRLTLTPDVVSVKPVSLVVGTREALHREIDRWLQEMQLHHRSARLFAVPSTAPHGL
jgi:hypothetical protein